MKTFYCLFLKMENRRIIFNYPNIFYIFFLFRITKKIILKIPNFFHTIPHFFRPRETWPRSSCRVAKLDPFSFFIFILAYWESKGEVGPRMQEWVPLIFVETHTSKWSNEITRLPSKRYKGVKFSSYQITLMSLPLILNILTNLI